MNIVHTIGVNNLLSTFNDLFVLNDLIKKRYNELPEKTNNGGEDLDFFIIKFTNIKLYICKNETNGLTVMLPDEY